MQPPSAWYFPSDAGDDSLQASVPLSLGRILVPAVPLCVYIGVAHRRKAGGRSTRLFKFLGVILILPFLGPFTDLVISTPADPARQIANAHTLFNVGIAVVFLPLQALARLIEFIIPERAEPIPELEKPLFLERHPSILRPSSRTGAGGDHPHRSDDQPDGSESGEIPASYDEDLATRIWQLEAGVDALYRHVEVSWQISPKATY